MGDSLSTRWGLDDSILANGIYTNAVYFPNQRIRLGDSPGMLDFGCVNHVYYAYAALRRDGTVYLSDMWADMLAPIDGTNKGGVGSLQSLKMKHPHLQVVLSVGGSAVPGEIFANVARDPLQRDMFANTAGQLIETTGLDGIDVAWQYPQTADECANLVALVAHVRAHLPPGRLVTAALPADMPLLKQVDVYQLAPHIDYMNLTAYGFRDGRHHAQLYAMSRDEPSGAAAVVHLLARGFPAKKILLGIPTHAQGTGNVGLVGGPDPALEYQHLPRRGCVEVVDRRHVAAQFVGGEAGDGSVSYDNVETVTAKAGFCKSKGLAGLFFWNAPADSKDKTRSLVAAGFRALHTLQ